MKRITSPLAALLRGSPQNVSQMRRQRRRHPSWQLELVVIAGASIGCLSVSAFAQTAASSDPSAPADVRTGPIVIASSSQNSQASPIAAPNTPGIGLQQPGIPAAISALPVNDLYADVEWKGLVFNIPPPRATVDGDFAFREKLATDYGIGYTGWSIDTFTDNLLRHNHHGVQTYSGQKPTGSSSNNADVIVDLSRYGIPDGQIVISGSYLSYSWNPSGPTSLVLNGATYYQTFLNRHIEFKAGLLASNGEFYGTFTGGNLSSGLYGPAGSQYNEAGGTTLGTPTYGADVTVHPTAHFYDRFGVTRSANPSGVLLEHNWNPTATRFSTPNSGVFVLNEVGYKARPGGSGGSTWVRLGTGYSSARYVEQDHSTERSPNNYLIYFNADQQLLQTSQKPNQSYRGLYAGFSIAYVPPNLNLFSQYYEARLYGVGILPSRPFDQVSLVATDTVFSNFAYNIARFAGRLAHNDSKAATLSYSYRLFRGIYLNAAVAYVNNPSPLLYTPSTGSALNVITAIAIFF